MTILAVAMLSLLMMFGVVALGLGQWALASARLSAAADLSALAGAQTWRNPCEHAASVAQANGTTLIDCHIDGADVVTTVQMPAPPFAAHVAALLGRDASALRRSARAGQQEIEQADGG